MKNRIVLSALTLLAAVSLVSCGEDKKAPATETTVTATATETPASSKTVASSGVHPTEQKLYDFSSVYIDKIEAAIAEPDDDKAIARLNAINTEMKVQAEALKPEFQSWMGSLTKEEEKALGERIMQQPATAKAFQMMGDAKLVRRLEKNPKFRAAFEKANSGPTEVWQPNEK
ncbi:hypothetical protein [Flavisolibacter tropicus]|uniref:Uncharacterized protein n=1 Tax=Flavisolibacter tropicus TaxID=1492898 RepID=A0A172TVD5_9BACT|nr:hypothetical protein [Flavisolibacter tropicus]ANE51000.1 hypothetical protein SY85_11295 [Flavisolibacter tropicus]